MLLLINLLIFWITYYAAHSFLAATSVKSYFKKTAGMSERKYRLFYVMISLAGFIYLLFYTATLSHHYLWMSMFSKFFGLMLATYGIFVVREAFRNYHTKAFLGLADPNLESKTLVKEGLQKHIRHPLYAGTLLLFLGFFFYMPTRENLGVVVVSVLYIFVGIYLEEKKLLQTFGNEYREYRKEVPMLIPRLKR